MVRNKSSEKRAWRIYCKSKCWNISLAASQSFFLFFLFSLFYHFITTHLSKRRNGHEGGGDGQERGGEGIRLSSGVYLVGARERGGRGSRPPFVLNEIESYTRDLITNWLVDLHTDCQRMLLKKITVSRDRNSNTFFSFSSNTYIKPFVEIFVITSYN